MKVKMKPDELTFELLLTFLSCAFGRKDGSASGGVDIEWKKRGGMHSKLIALEIEGGVHQTPEEAAEALFGLDGFRIEAEAGGSRSELWYYPEESSETPLLILEGGRYSLNQVFVDIWEKCKGDLEEYETSSPFLRPMETAEDGATRVQAEAGYDGVNARYAWSGLQAESEKEAAKILIERLEEGLEKDRFREEPSWQHQEYGNE